MAMPRPSNKALEIAMKVVPGLRAQLESQRRLPDKKKTRGSMSKVEIEQTKLIER